MYLAVGMFIARGSVIASTGERVIIMFSWPLAFLIWMFK
jgi:hypothetical protein